MNPQKYDIHIRSFFIVAISLIFFSGSTHADLRFVCGENSFDAKTSISIFEVTIKNKEKLACKDPGPTIELFGEISAEDAQWFKKYTELKSLLLGSDTTSLNLNSEGGDVLAALSIAGDIRADELLAFTVGVWNRKICYSACIVVLAAGYQRTVAGGKVGLHRPYLSQEMADLYGYNDLKSFYDVLYRDLETYFREVNLDRSVLDIMWRTPSHQMYLLSSAELKSTGLGENDFVFTEQRNLRKRDLCGADGPALEEDYEKALNQCLISRVGSRTVKKEDFDYCVNTSELLNHPFTKLCQDKLYRTPSTP